MSENTNTVITVAKLSFFVAFAVVALMAIRQPAAAPAGNCSDASEAKPAHTALDQPEEDDVVIARVNGRPIYRSGFNAVFQNLSPQARQYGMETIYPVLLGRLVDEKLLATVAVSNIPADDPELAKEVRRLTEGAITQIYFSRTIEAAVTEETIRESYETSVAGFSPADEVSARHILLETEEKANEVLAIVQGGADFAETAKQHSTGPSAPNGGDLGYFQHGQMVAPFADAAFALQPGEVAPEPVKSEFGWHIIKVEGRRQTMPPSFEEKREEISSGLSREVAVALLDDLRGKAEIEKFDLQGKPLPVEPEASTEPEAPAGAEQGQEAPPAQ